MEAFLRLPLTGRFVTKEPNTRLASIGGGNAEFKAGTILPTLPDSFRDATKTDEIPIELKCLFVRLFRWPFLFEARGALSDGDVLDRREQVGSVHTGRSANVAKSPLLSSRQRSLG